MLLEDFDHVVDAAAEVRRADHVQEAPRCRGHSQTAALDVFERSLIAVVQPAAAPDVQRPLADAGRVHGPIRRQLGPLVELEESIEGAGQACLGQGVPESCGRPRRKRVFGMRSVRPCHAMALRCET